MLFKLDKFRNKFFLFAIGYVILGLTGLLALSFYWLPPGNAIVGHDSGLPLNAKEFIQTRFYAWDDRLDFGLDNSVNFGSLTIHFIDWASSVISGVPYAGNYVSVFFWLGLIFVSGVVFAYQLKDVFGKSFVFILPPLLVFNFYIFQSVFMLERAKYGIFSGLLIFLAVYFRLYNQRLSVLPAALISSLTFSIFNGGGLFGITLYGGVIAIFVVIVIHVFSRGLVSRNFEELRKTLLFFALCLVFYLAFNAYSIIPYVKQFLIDNPQALFKASSIESNKEWLGYVSRSSSFLNLFRFLGVPDWYGGVGQVERANIEHPYAAYYLNNFILSSLNFLFPILAFSSLFLAKNKATRRILSLFAVIALFEMFLAAGSHEPLGSVYTSLMNYVPGFVLFRSAFYKFGIFYLLGMLVMFTFTVTVFIDKLSKLFPINFKKSALFIFTFTAIGLWSTYHWVLFDSSKVFSWKSDQSTRVQPPEYIFDFTRWAGKNNLGEKRILLLPPVNKNWQSDAYSWGYWSLSPLPYALSTARVISRWHGLTNEETALIDRLYGSIKENNESPFLQFAEKLNIGYLLLREDVLTDSTWSSSERPESYKKAIESFEKVSKVKKFGEWEFYKISTNVNSEVYTTSEVNIAPDRYVTLANNFFEEGHSVGSTVLKLYPEFESFKTKLMQVYDCLSCPFEKKFNLQSSPEVEILPNSILYAFKEDQEQKLLATQKDPRSKMGDYLGLVLRRSAEQQRMLDLRIKEKYLLENAVTIRTYLGEIYSLLEVTPDKTNDFELANMVLEYLSPADRVFSDRVIRSDFKADSNKLIDEMLGVVWEIERIKGFFTPLLTNIEQWSTKKVYKVVFPEDGKYNIFFPTTSLPKALDGSIILPETVELKIDDQAKTLDIEEAQESWMVTRVEEKKGTGEYTLRFPDLPNLLTLESSALEKFSFGEAACFKGKIANFDPRRAYEIKVWKKDRLRSVKIIFSDDEFTYSEKHGFLQGEDSFEVPATAEGSYARYVFFPSVSAKIISLYICSDNAELPPIDKIEAKEFFSPPVIGVNGSYQSKDSPDISYSRENPTSYTAVASEVKNTAYTLNTPYVFVFNEKFNPSWQLLAQNEDGEFLSIDKHFTVDGYANGWLITDPKIKKFKIEYAPQSVFYKAGVFSAVSVLAAVSWLIFTFVRSRRKNKQSLQ